MLIKGFANLLNLLPTVLLMSKMIPSKRKKKGKKVGEETGFI